MKLKVNLTHNAIMPGKTRLTDIEYNLYTPIDFFVGPFQRFTLWTGVSLDLPRGYYALIKNKYGLFKKYGIITDGMIDSPGQIGITLLNTTSKKVVFERGDKIAKFVVMKGEDVSLLTEDDTGE